MKYLKKTLLLLLIVFVIVAFISSCQSSSTTAPDFNKFKISKWGPNEGKVGTIPNKQPSGKVGIWMDVPTTEGFGELQILFNGHPAPSSTQPEHVTAGVDPEELMVVGDKKVELKQLSTGKIIPVGIFKVTP